MSAIRSVHARQILDSRGNPTLEAEVGRWRAEVDALEARAEAEGMEAVLPLLRRR